MAMTFRSEVSAALVLVALVAGCVTRPTPSRVETSRPYAEPFDATWERLVAFFASRNMQVKNIAKDSGVIYAETLAFPSSLADCGSAGIMEPIGRRLSFNVFVSRAEPKTVTVRADFFEDRRFMDVRSMPFKCESRGALERDILDAATRP